jgi:hypothetical protein
MSLYADVAGALAAGGEEAAALAALGGVFALACRREWLTLDLELRSWDVAGTPPAVLEALLCATRVPAVAARLPSRDGFAARVAALTPPPERP